MTNYNSLRSFRYILVKDNSLVVHHSRRYFSKEIQDARQRVSHSIKQRVVGSVEFVDDTLGVTEVSKAQDDVSLKESEFLLARKKVQSVRTELEEQQETLHMTRKQLDRTDRANENYLNFVSNEHKILLQVQNLIKKQNEMETAERIAFNDFSSAIRSSHEKERSRVERTKYWSIIASVSGTILGFVLSSFVTHYRLKKIENVSEQRWIQSSKSVEDMLSNFHSKTMEEISTLSNLQTAMPKEEVNLQNMDEVLDHLQNHLNQVDTKCDKALYIVDEINQELKRIKSFDGNLQPLHHPVTSTSSQTSNIQSTSPNIQILQDTKTSDHKSFPENDSAQQIPTVTPSVPTENQVEHIGAINIASPTGGNITTPPIKQYMPLLIFVGSGALLIYSMMGQF